MATIATMNIDVGETTAKDSYVCWWVSVSLSRTICDVVATSTASITKAYAIESNYKYNKFHTQSSYPCEHELNLGLSEEAYDDEDEDGCRVVPEHLRRLHTKRCHLSEDKHREDDGRTEHGEANDEELVQDVQV